MPAWICRTCGVQYPESGEPPAACPICLDERQYVGWGGQQWTTMAELASDRAVVLREEEPDLIGVGVEPGFAIGQRALLVRTPHGNVLWDCVSLLDDAARARIGELGGIAAICMSHPHFYGVNVEYADAFDARILIPRADQAVGTAALAAHRVLRRRRRAGARGHPGPDRRALRRRGRAALAGRVGQAAARCSPGTPSRWCRTGTGSASCGATPT